MATVRVAPEKVGRLVRVALTDVDERRRLLASRALREARWEHELRPDIGYSPTMRQRERACLDACLLEAAATDPSTFRYLLPEEAVKRVLGDWDG